jgi:hypothetical protein
MMNDLILTDDVDEETEEDEELNEEVSYENLSEAELSKQLKSSLSQLALIAIFRAKGKAVPLNTVLDTIKVAGNFYVQSKYKLKDIDAESSGGTFSDFKKIIDQADEKENTNG